MEGKQLSAVFGFLAFAGAFLTLMGVVAAIVAIRLAGEERLSRAASRTSAWLFGGRGLAQKLAIVGLILIAGYSTTLVAASVASRERVLSSGEEKYFCEIDCHLAYSVAGVERTKTLPATPHDESAAGTFYVVSVRTRFDERTISPHRGDAPLTPSPRLLTIVDARGHSFPISTSAQQSLESSLGNRWIPPTTPLRPGESYVTQFVFDLPQGTTAPKLLIESPTSPSWIGRAVVGGEDSIFHKKVYLSLPN